MEALLGRRAGHGNTVQLRHGQDIKREIHVAARRKASIEGERIHAGLIDRDIRAVIGMADRCAIHQCIAVEDQRSLSRACLRRRGVGGQQLDRLCSACCTARDREVKHGILLCAAVGNCGVCTRLSRCHRTDIDGGRGSGAASAAGTAGCSGRTGWSCRTCRAGCTRGTGGATSGTNIYTTLLLRKLESV